MSEAHVTNISKELINLSFISLSTCSMLSLIKTQATNCNVYTCTLIFSDFMKCDNQWKLLFVWVCFFKNFVRFKNFENMHVQYVCKILYGFFIQFFLHFSKSNEIRCIKNIFFIVIYYTRYFKSFIYTRDIFLYLISNPHLSLWHGLRTC